MASHTEFLTVPISRISKSTTDARRRSSIPGFRAAALFADNVSDKRKKCEGVLSHRIAEKVLYFLVLVAIVAIVAAIPP
jgi:hypothetical protein